MPVDLDLGRFAGLVVAIVGGAAVGVERQRSGHATGPDARLGGIRTFTLLGTAAGIAGFLMAAGFAFVAALLMTGALALIAIGYFRASSRDVDATTEVAAVVVLGAGTLAGIGELRLSAALTTLTVLLLAEKPRLHGVIEVGSMNVNGRAHGFLGSYGIVGATISTDSVTWIDSL